jgi:hypothetical protein
LPTTINWGQFPIVLADGFRSHAYLPAALGSNAAHRSAAATFATRLTQHVGQAEKSLQSRTAWGPFFERKTRKMRPHGGRLKRDFNVKTIGI